MSPTFKWLGVCGSLRARSSNRALLEAYGRVAAGSAALELYRGLGSLPHFNPDRDGEPIDPAVGEFRRQVRTNDALILSTPEYAHALPGSFKNALDWLVSEPDFPGKLVVTLSADRGSRWALDSLHEVLRTMSADLRIEACVSLPLGSNRVTSDDLLSRSEIVGALTNSATELLRACRARRPTIRGSSDPAP